MLETLGMTNQQFLASYQLLSFYSFGPGRGRLPEVFLRSEGGPQASTHPPISPSTAATANSSSKPYW